MENACRLQETHRITAAKHPQDVHQESTNMAPVAQDDGHCKNTDSTSVQRHALLKQVDEFIFESLAWKRW